ncbi:MAG: PP0621 family protein [Pseudomonadota bacterium]
MLIRVALLFALIWLAVRFVKRLTRAEPGDGNSTGTAIDTLRCARCDLVVPKSEAVHNDGKDYCSNQCAARDQRT